MTSSSSSHGMDGNKKVKNQLSDNSNTVIHAGDNDTNETQVDIDSQYNYGDCEQYNEYLDIEEGECEEKENQDIANDQEIENENSVGHDGQAENVDSVHEANKNSEEMDVNKRHSNSSLENHSNLRRNSRAYGKSDFNTRTTPQDFEERLKRLSLPGSNEGWIYFYPTYFYIKVQALLRSKTHVLKIGKDQIHVFTINAFPYKGTEDTSYIKKVIELKAIKQVQVQNDGTIVLHYFCEKKNRQVQNTFKFSLTTHNPSNSLSESYVPRNASILNSFLANIHFAWDASIEHTNSVSNCITKNRRKTFNNVQWLQFFGSTTDSLVSQMVKLHINSTHITLQDVSEGRKIQMYPSRVWSLHLLKKVELVLKDYIIFYFGESSNSRLILVSNEREELRETIQENLKLVFGLTLNAVFVPTSADPEKKHPVGEYVLRTTTSIEKEIKLRQLVRCIRLDDSSVMNIFRGEEPSNILSRMKEVETNELVELILTADSMYECDPHSGCIYNNFSLEEIYSLIRVAGDDEMFMIEYYNTRDPKVYFICNPQLDIEEGNTQELMNYYIDNHVYRPSCTRDELLGSIVEFADRANKLIIIQSEPLTQFYSWATNINAFNDSSLSDLSNNGRIKFGEKFHCDFEFEEALMKQISILNVKDIAATLSTEWIPLLQLFVSNFNLNNHRHEKEKKALKNVLALLQMLLQIEKQPAEQRKQSELSDKLDGCIVLVLNTIANLLTIKEINESIDSFSNELTSIVSLIHSKSPMISYMASTVLRFSIDQIFPHKNSKKEHQHRIILLGKRPQFFEELFPNFTTSSLNDMKYNSPVQHYTLSLGTISTILELMLHSSASSTEKSLFDAILNQTISYLMIILRYSWQSSNIQVIYNTMSVCRTVLSLIKSRTQKSANRFQNYQKDALGSAIHLQLIHLLNRYPLGLNDEPTMVNAAVVLGLLSEGFLPAMNLLHRIIPAGIYKQLYGTFNEVEEYTLSVNRTFFNRKIANSQKGEKSTIPQSPELRHDWFSFGKAFSLDAANPFLIWNNMTRYEMCNAIETELRLIEEVRYNLILEQSSKHIIWNHEEFNIQIPALSNEAKVSGYYIKFFVMPGNSIGLGKDYPVNNPLHFMEELHHFITFSNSFKNRLLALRAITKVCEQYQAEIGTYPYIHHLLDFVSERHDRLNNEEDKILLHASLVFISRLLKGAGQNVEKFISYGGISTIMFYIRLIHRSEHFNREVQFLTKLNDPLYPPSTPLNFYIADVCITLLSQCVNYHRTKNEANEIIIPPPRVKTIISTLVDKKSYFEQIISMLMVASPTSPSKALYRNIIIQKVVPTLAELLSYNHQLQCEIWKTGLFYFLLNIDGEMEPSVATLLKDVHRKQVGFVRESMTSSFLENILPKETVMMLDKTTPSAFCQAFNGASSTPLMIWNSTMRNRLIEKISEYTADFATKLQNDTTSVFEKPEKDLMIEYPELSSKFVCNNYYMEYFVDRSTWPTGFVIEDSSQFLTEIFEVLSTLAVGSQITSDVLPKIILCIKAQHLILSYGDAEVFDNYSGASTLIQCLNQKCRKDKDSIELLFHTIRLCTLVSKKSSINRENFLKVGLVSSLHEIIRQCLLLIDYSQITAAKADEKRDSVEKDDDFYLTLLTCDEIALEIITNSIDLLNYLLESNESSTLENILLLQYSSNNDSIIDSVTQILRLDVEQSFCLIQSSVIFMSRISKNSELQRALFRSGAFILLLGYIRDYRSGEVYMELAKLAVIAISRISGLSKSENPCPSNNEIAEILQRIYPGHFITMLMNKPEDILKEYNNSMESPRVLWNEHTMYELDALLDKEIEKLNLHDEKGNVIYDPSTLHNFSYKRHAIELRSADIFVRHFNKLQPESEVNFFTDQKEVHSFLSGLCEILISEVEQGKQAAQISQYSTERIEIILHALYKCMTHISTRWSQLASQLLPVLISLIGKAPMYIVERPEKQILCISFKKIVYYGIELIFHSLTSTDLHDRVKICLIILNSSILESFKKLIYGFLLKNVTQGKRIVLNDNMSELHIIESVITTCYHILICKDAVFDIIQVQRQGLLPIALAIVIGVFAQRPSLRSKCSFVLGEILIRDFSKSVFNEMKMILPEILIIAFQKNALDTPNYLKESYSSPELIWDTDRRKILMNYIEEAVTSFSSLVQENNSALFQIEKPVDYSFPFQVDGIYPMTYSENPSYPITDTKVFVSALISKMKEGSNVGVLSEALFAATGGERYFNKAAVDALTPYVDDLCALLSTEESTAKIHLFKVFSRLSINPPSLTRLLLSKGILNTLINVMESEEEVRFIGMEIILRLTLKNRSIIEQLVPESRTVQFLISVLKSQQTPLKMIASQILKKACDLIKQNIDQLGDLYKEYVAESDLPVEEELFKQPRNVLISGDKYSYIKIDLDKRNENEREAKTLFSRTSNENVILRLSHDEKNTGQVSRNVKSIPTEVETKNEESPARPQSKPPRIVGLDSNIIDQVGVEKVYIGEKSESTKELKSTSINSTSSQDSTSNSQMESSIPNEVPAPDLVSESNNLTPTSKEKTEDAPKVDTTSSIPNSIPLPDNNSSSQVSKSISSSPSPVAMSPPPITDIPPPPKIDIPPPPPITKCLPDSRSASAIPQYASTSSSPPRTGIPPPPPMNGVPPPPSIGIPPPPKSDNNVPLSGGIPPPPPPPPIPSTSSNTNQLTLMEQIRNGVKLKKVEQQAPKPTSSGGDHSDLMAQIRAGVKLKKVDQDAPKSPTSSNLGGHDSLMAQIRAGVKLRKVEQVPNQSTSSTEGGHASIMEQIRAGVQLRKVDPTQNLKIVPPKTNKPLSIQDELRSRIAERRTAILENHQSSSSDDDF